MKLITVTNIDKECANFGKKMQWSLENVLDEINRDHSNDWVNYTEKDWVEGWLEWVEGIYYSISESDLDIGFFSSFTPCA